MPRFEPADRRVQGVCAYAGRRTEQADVRARSAVMNNQLITVDPEIQGGAPVFAGTRVPVKTLFDHLEAGDSLEIFLNVSRR